LACQLARRVPIRFQENRLAVWPLGIERAAPIRPLLGRDLADDLGEGGGNLIKRAVGGGVGFPAIGKPDEGFRVAVLRYVQHCRCVFHIEDNITLRARHKVYFANSSDLFR